MSPPTSPTPASRAPLPLSGRSTTAPVKPPHHHYHRPHVRSHNHHHQRDKSTPHSAVVPSTKTLDQLLSPITRVTARLPTSSTNASRNDLVRRSDAAKLEDVEGEGQKRVEKTEREVSQWREVTDMKVRRNNQAQ